MSRRQDRALRWLALAGWLAAIWWLSDQPDLPHAPEPLLDFLLKKGLHAAGYGVLALLWRGALGGRSAPGLLGAVAWAGLDEWHQTWVPGRTGRIADVAIDAAGAAAALLAVALLARRRQPVSVPGNLEPARDVYPTGRPGPRPGGDGAG